MSQIINIKINLKKKRARGSRETYTQWSYYNEYNTNLNEKKHFFSMKINTLCVSTKRFEKPFDHSRRCRILLEVNLLPPK